MSLGGKNLEMVCKSLYKTISKVKPALYFFVKVKRFTEHICVKIPDSCP